METARVGDVYRFIYKDRPQYNADLGVVEVMGDQPDSLVFFDDGTHSKQKNLVGVPCVHRAARTPPTRRFFWKRIWSLF